MKSKLFLFVLTVLLSFSVATQAFAGVDTYIFKAGDTLWELAARLFGDPTLYPVFMEVNGIDNPRAIPNGAEIIIPDKSTLKKIAQERDQDKRQEMIDNAKSGVESESSLDDDSQNQNDQSPDSVSRTGQKVDPEETSFNDILKGPKVSPDKLIHVDSD
ncbi:MAG: LysM peptidoglycan-binding domain-containing protein [Candidatus Rifleibacteriota bacterium]